MIDFGEAKLIFEVRGLVDGKQWKVTNEFYTDEGVIRDGKFFPKGKSEGEPIENFPPPGAPEQGPRHLRNFIDCVRSRKREDLNAEILEGHRSAMLGHLGNISYRLGEDVPFNRGRPRPSATTRPFHESFEDMKRHLADAGGGTGRHSLPPRPHAAVRRPGREVRRGPGRRPVAQPVLPRPLRGAGTGVTHGSPTSYIKEYFL